MVVLETSHDEFEDTRGQHAQIISRNIRKKVKNTTMMNGCNKLFSDTNIRNKVEGLEPDDFLIDLKRVASGM